jgi:hypothetical protein
MEMDGWMDGWMCEQVNVCVYVCVCVCVWSPWEAPHMEALVLHLSSSCLERTSADASRSQEFTPFTSW